jgi:hypothetical protein
MKLRFSWRFLFWLLAFACFLTGGQIWQKEIGGKNLEWSLANFPGLNFTVISIEILIISVIFGILGLVLGIVWGTARIDKVLGSFLIVLNLVSAMSWFSWELGKSSFIPVGIYVTIVLVIDLATAGSFVPEKIDSL